VGCYRYYHQLQSNHHIKNATNHHHHHHLLLLITSLCEIHKNKSKNKYIFFLVWVSNPFVRNHTFEHFLHLSGNLPPHRFDASPSTERKKEREREIY